VIAAATPDVNRQVAAAAEVRRIFVNAVDDPANASAFLSGVVRRDGVTVAISTRGTAPALTALLREALDDLLPADLEKWLEEAHRQRLTWRKNGLAMKERRPLLLEALNRLYHRSTDSAVEEPDGSVRPQPDPPGRPDGGHYRDAAHPFRAAKDAS
jgi:siroheme synthase-like protein